MSSTNRIPMMRRLIRACSPMIIGGWVLACPMTALGEISKEYQLKAAFLFKFLNFIQWEDGDSSPKIVCVYGENPFGDTIERLITVNDQNFSRTKVLKTQSIEELSHCDMAYISRSEERHLKDILSQLRNYRVVTVSDIDQFASEGGIIELQSQEGKIGFVINQGQAKADGIRISAQLLSLARLVRTG